MNETAEPNGGNGSWRSLAKFQIAQSEAKITALEAALRRLDGGMSDMRVEQAAMKGDIGSLRDDIVKATSQLEAGRRNEMDLLRGSIGDAQKKTANIILYLIFPIVVTVVAALLVYALTGAGGH